jgi:hypothetical protein
LARAPHLRFGAPNAIVRLADSSAGSARSLVGMARSHTDASDF